MTLPAIKAVIEKFPGAKIDLITSREGARLLKNFHPQIDQIFSCRAAFPRRLIDFYRVKRAMRNKQYDHVYCFEDKPRHICLLPQANIKLILKSKNKKTHYANHCLNLIRGDESNDYPNEAYLKPTTAGANSLSEQLKQYSIQGDEILVGFHPTFSGSQKLFNYGKIHRSWPASHFARLAKILVDFAKDQNLKLRIVMDVLPEERRIGEKILEQAPGLITQMTIKPNMQRYIAYLNRLDVLISPNTGTMHLAAALDTPTVALFSGFSPEDCGPYMNQNKCKVIRAEDGKNPELGLKGVTPEEAAKAICELLRLSVH